MVQIPERWEGTLPGDRHVVAEARTARTWEVEIVGTGTSAHLTTAQLGVIVDQAAIAEKAAEWGVDLGDCVEMSGRLLADLFAQGLTEGEPEAHAVEMLAVQAVDWRYVAGRDLIRRGWEQSGGITGAEGIAERLARQVYDAAGNDEHAGRLFAIGTFHVYHELRRGGEAPDLDRTQLERLAWGRRQDQDQDPDLDLDPQGSGRPAGQEQLTPDELALVEGMRTVWQYAHEPVEVIAMIDIAEIWITVSLIAPGHFQTVTLSHRDAPASPVTLRLAREVVADLLAGLRRLVDDPYRDDKITALFDALRVPTGAIVQAIASLHEQG